MSLPAVVLVVGTVFVLSIWASAGLIAEFLGTAGWPTPMRQFARWASVDGGWSRSPDWTSRPVVRYPVRALRLIVGLTLAVGGQALLVLLLADRWRDFDIAGATLIVAEIAAFAMATGYLMMNAKRP